MNDGSTAYVPTSLNGASFSSSFSVFVSGIRFPGLLTPLRSLVHLVWVDANMHQIDIHCTQPAFLRPPLWPLPRYVKIEAYLVGSEIASAQNMAAPSKASVAKPVSNHSDAEPSLYIFMAMPS